MCSPAVFLDRDGTIIADCHYLDNVAQVQLLPGAGVALRQLADAGFVLVLITNQSGIGRGYFPATMVDAQHQRLQELLAAHGVTFADMLFCPHRPDQQCACRKPLPGMLHAAAARHHLELGQSYMIGDKTADVQAGRAAGCATVQVQATYQLDPAADFVAADLVAAANWIISRNHRDSAPTR